MKIAFLTICAPGHLYPTTTLARKLKERGHEVALLSVLDAEPFAQAAGIPFIPCCETDYPVGSIPGLLDQLSRLQAQEAVEYTFRILTDGTESMLKHLPQTLAEVRVDGLVLDAAVLGLGVVPMHLGIPYVHVSNALHVDFSGNTPVCFFDWPHETTPEAVARNHAGLQKINQIFEKSMALARDYAEQAQLKIDWDDPFATMSELAWITQSPKPFEFENSQLPAQFHHAGPFHDGFGRIDSEFPWDRLTGEPLIYASMGTLQNGLESVFSSIAKAVGERPGKQLVLSIGPALDPEQIRSLPANAIVVKNAPQVELLKRSALCITHAGLNTVLESLTQGVPLVAIPITNDQPGVAARIAHTQTGTFLPLEQLSALRLAALIDEVLDDPRYRRNAGRMKQAIAEANGLEKAVDLLEQKFGLGVLQR